MPTVCIKTEVAAVEEVLAHRPWAAYRRSRYHASQIAVAQDG
jgi:hypothetical protein